MQCCAPIIFIYIYRVRVRTSIARTYTYVCTRTSALYYIFFIINHACMRICMHMIICIYYEFEDALKQAMKQSAICASDRLRLADEVAADAADDDDGEEEEDTGSVH